MPGLCRQCPSPAGGRSPVVFPETSLYVRRRFWPAYPAGLCNRLLLVPACAGRKPLLFQSGPSKSPFFGLVYYCCLVPLPYQPRKSANANACQRLYIACQATLSRGGTVSPCSLVQASCHAGRTDPQLFLMCRHWFAFLRAIARDKSGSHGCDLVSVRLTDGRPP